jgi:shikimate 5-dehydrogenase
MQSQTAPHLVLTPFGEFSVTPRPQPTFFFVGVTTGKSSINRIFPHWMKLLGRPDVILEGIDHKIHDDPAAYRATVAQVKYDANCLGGLVTTHKMDVYSAARDMFDYFDPYANVCAEISSISKRGTRLEGHAKDPITAGLSMDAIVGDDYFARTGGDVLCFGAGGSGLATLLHLINKPNKGDRPARFIAVNRSLGKLEHMRDMVAQYNTDIEIEYVQNVDPAVNDALMAALPERSIVINATGMGKDTPGSPVTDAGLFPRDGIAWEFNYRGELDFMHQALRQVESRNVRVEDGWVYFVHGWTQVIAQVLDVNIDAALFQELADVAASVR